VKERWFQFDPVEFLVDVSGRSLELRGAYATLLAETYDRPVPLRFPEDIAEIRHLFAVSRANKVRSLILELQRIRLIQIDESGFIIPATFNPARWGRRAATLREREAIVARDGSACRACGSSENLCIDHIVPVAKGGRNAPANLQILCRSCNSKKGPRL
jgi:hypothetical protein